MERRKIHVIAELEDPKELFYRGFAHLQSDVNVYDLYREMNKEWLTLISTNVDGVFQSSFWDKYLAAIQKRSEAPTVQIGIGLIGSCARTLLKEYGVITEFRPNIFYQEGSKDDILCRSLGLVAEKHHARVVYLDDGFEPYLKHIIKYSRLPKMSTPEEFREFRVERIGDAVDAQKGREEHWKELVLKNLPELNKKALLLVYNRHLVRGPVPYIGNFPDMLRENGIDVEVMEYV